MASNHSNIDPARLRALKLLRKNAEVRLASHDFTKEIALIFRDYVNLSRCKTVHDLLKLIKDEGEYLLSLYPTEFILRNVICIITKFIREEAEKLVNGGEKEESTAIDSLINLWNDPKESNWNVNMRELRKAVMGSIEEHAEALDSSSEELAEKALNHVMAKDKVMTFRYSSSDTLKSFLKGVKCSILSVDDVECKSTKEDVYTAIPSTDVVIQMRNVTRVILSAVAVLPDGSCVMGGGTRLICEVAKNFSVPVIVCSAIYKFTPMFFPNLNDFNRHGSVGQLLDGDAELLSFPNLSVSNPIFDHIPAKLINLYVTQDSPISPGHVHEILSECYHPNDLYIFEKEG